MFVYILESVKNGKHYIGSTNDLKRRLHDHNAGCGSSFTKLHRPWQLVCYYACVSEKEARVLEKKVKSYKGGNGFKKIIHGELAEWSKAPHC